MLYNREDLIEAFGEELIYIDKNYNFNVDNVVFDNRETTENSLFVARKGENTDGHFFIKATLENNNSTVILAEYIPDDVKQNPRIILVKNTVKAFEKLAIFSRARLKGNIIGITGSVGKTSTKDAFYHCFSNLGKSFCSQHSFNNYNGILTTLSNIPKDMEYCICEMGMNTYGEMDVIRNLLKPEIAVILNVKPAHLGNFKNEEEIAIEKSKIIDKNNTKAVILNLDNKWFEFLKKQAENCGIKNIITFGIDENADVVLKKHVIENNLAKVEYIVENKVYNCTLNNIDYNIAYNCMAILAVALYLKIDINKILESFSTIESTRGRNNIEYTNYEFNGKNINLTLINGSYNAVAPETFITGLNLMDNIFKQGKNNRKICIWGDMLECGEKAAEFHLSLKKYILNNKIDLLVTIGESMKLLNNSLKDENIRTLHFGDIDDLINNIKEILNDKDLVFIKSSKGIKTYKILNYLVKNKMKIFL